jgi:3-isopropylmalate dehydratase small subunit
MVVAISFARIFRRNAINIGLPVFCADIRTGLCQGDLVEVDLATGRIVTPKGVTEAAPMSPNVLSTIEAGGLIGASG